MDAKTARVLADLAATLVALVDESGPAKTVPAKKAAKKSAKQPKAVVAAKQHCFEARMTRRNDPANARNAKGMTKAEKSELYRAHPELGTMSEKARKAAWTKLVAAYKAA